MTIPSILLAQKDTLFSTPAFIAAGSPLYFFSAQGFWAFFGIMLLRGLLFLLCGLAIYLLAESYEKNLGFGLALTDQMTYEAVHKEI